MDNAKTFRAVLKTRGDDTNHVYACVGSVEEHVGEWLKAKKLAELRRGHFVMWDGATIHRERRVRYDTNHVGSGAYTWNEDGSKVKCDWYEITESDSGTHERRLSSVWVSYERATR